MTERTSADWRARKASWAICRHALHLGRAFYGWGWLLMPWALPWDAVPCINYGGDVEA